MAYFDTIDRRREDFVFSFAVFFVDDDCNLVGRKEEMFKKSRKIKAAVAFFAVLIIGLLVMMVISLVTNSSERKGYARTNITRMVSDRVTVLDADGLPLYSGEYAKDRVLREAMFPILGSNSEKKLLVDAEQQAVSYSRFFGPKVTDTTVNLTIDRDLQVNAYSALEESGFFGSIFIANYETGTIRAMVSYPSLDVKNTENEVKNDNTKKYLNRNMLAYTPGSVFKAVSAAAVLENLSGASGKKFTCTGQYKDVVCYEKTKHGEETLASVLLNSCNCGTAYFSSLILPEDIEQFVSVSKICGSDLISDFDGGCEQGTFTTKNIGWACVGQGEDNITPIAVANYYSALANGGIRRNFKLLRETEIDKGSRIMMESTAAYITKALTPLAANQIKCKSFAKTGTAEVDNKPSHAWFVCALTDEKAPKYVCVVMLEHAGGSQNAKKVACDYINNNILTKGVRDK